MKIFLFAFLSLLMPASQANETIQPLIPLEIERIVSTGWQNGGGFFRAIIRNTEINPCVTLQSINLSKNKLAVSRDFCPHDIEVLNYYSAGKNLQLNNDNAGFFIEEVYFKETELIALIEVFLNRGPVLKIECHISFHKNKIAVYAPGNIRFFTTSPKYFYTVYNNIYEMCSQNFLISVWRDHFFY